MKQIVLIEDNAGDIRLIKEILLFATSEIRIRVAMDGEQALQVLADSDFKPTLIILDLNIPRIPGLELLARCKPSAPVVVFSSSSNPSEVHQAMELGVRECVEKPYDFQEFAKVVTKMIQD